MGIFAVFFLVTLTVIYYIHAERGEELQKQGIEDFGREEQIHAQHLATQVEKTVENVFDNLYILAEIRDVKEATPLCGSVVSAVYSKIKSKANAVNRIGLDGTVLCSSNSDLQGVYVGNSPSFREALQSRSPVIGRAEINPRGVQIIAFYIPLFDGEVLKGVLGAEVPLGEIASKYLQQPGSRYESYVFILDDDGTILYHPEKRFIMRQVSDPEVGLELGINSELNQLLQKLLNGQSDESFYYYDEDMVSGYASVKLGYNRMWVLGVVTPAVVVNPNIAALMDGIYVETVILVGFLIVIGFITTVLFRRWNDYLRREVESKTAKLRISEEKYRGLVETSIDAIISTNEKGQIILWNKAAEKIFGYSREEALGKPLTIIIPEEYRQKHRRSFKRYLETGETRVIGRTVELIGLRKDGTKFPIELSLSQNETPEGRVFTAFIRDISKRKSLEEEIREKHDELQKAYARLSALHRIERVISQSLNLEDVIKVALDEVLIQLNADAGGIYLLEEDGETLTLHFPHGLSDEFVEKLRKIKIGEGVSGIAAKKRRPIHLDITEYTAQKYESTLVKEGIKSIASAPIFSRGRIIGIITIGARKERSFSEDDLNLLGSIGMQLGTYIENSKLHEDLLRAYEDLKSLDELKSNLIARVSHELRTPITIAKGALELAALETDLESKNKLIKMALDALIRQNMIVGDLLEASMLERGVTSIKFEAVNLESAISITVEELKPLAAKRNISISTDIPKDLPKAWYDFDKLRHILRNLIHNAIKFNNDGGKVIIKARKRKDDVEVCVRDTGIGIPKDKLDKIFDRFYQIDSSLTRRYSGTGMGLAIVKEIVENYGGKIWVESDKGKGSKFCFTVPIAKPPED